MQDNDNGHYFLNTGVVHFKNRVPTQEQITRFHQAIKEAAKRAGCEFEFLLLQDNPAEVIKLIEVKMMVLANGAPAGGTFKADADMVQNMRTVLK